MSIKLFYLDLHLHPHLHRNPLKASCGAGSGVLGWQRIFQFRPLGKSRSAGNLANCPSTPRTPRSDLLDRGVRGPRNYLGGEMLSEREAKRFGAGVLLARAEHATSTICPHRVRTFCGQGIAKAVPIPRDMSGTIPGTNQGRGTLVTLLALPRRYQRRGAGPQNESLPPDHARPPGARDAQDGLPSR
jgi:hypothetical protein